MSITQNTFTILNHSIVADESWAIHKAGCRDIERESRRHGSHAYDVTGTLTDALAAVLDPDTRERGYDENNVKVHACCR